MTQPCEQHPHAPTFDGLCGGCTQYPADMVKPSGPAATEPGTTGYCPACGRGDVAPTPEEYEQQRQRAEQAEAKVTDYENRITWHTTCSSCARILDSSIRETDRLTAELADYDQRVEQLTAVLARVQALADEYPVAIDTARIHEALDTPGNQHPT